MKDSKVYVGKEALNFGSGEVKGEITVLGNEDFYCIRNFDQMPPFLMSIVSNSNHWMYLSSKGGVTAGRINPDNAIFPYYTDDKVHDSSENTGSITLLKCKREGKLYLWEPFSERYKGIYKLSRNLYKNIPGNKVIFEEENHDLGAVFRYSWMNSDRFGWIRKSELSNTSSETLEFDILDGIQNILPSGILRQSQVQFSTLMDAYKKNELVKEANLALYRLSSIPVDRAEPSESLRVNTVWTCGVESPTILLSISQLDFFRIGTQIEEETGTRGTRGAFLINASFGLPRGKQQDWIMVAEVRQDSSDVSSLITSLKKPNSLMKEVLEDVEKGSENLKSIVSSSDGIQECGDKLVSGRHFSNVLFNVMRGGLFLDTYLIHKEDFILHLQQFNKELAAKNERWLGEFGEHFEYADLLKKAEKDPDADFYRLALEYLPLSFSRRHGDPSRPWNIFSIDIKKEDGSKALSYQGNWRDIFQNWEALAMSYPLFIKGMIGKFLNASTADGYNPYRISREGFDWEIHDPSDPWSNIGYWGDHQIIYLLRLLEISEKFFPGEMEEWFNKEIFVFANVPYRIKPFTELVKNPQDSILFDEKLNEKLIKRAETMGSDGKLVTGTEGRIYTTNFIGKIMVSVLTKLSNFIPGAGIWMNTQRPEWNDANNALTGFGVSMVTLYQLRRHFEFLENLVNKSQSIEYKIPEELRSFFDEIRSSFIKNMDLIARGFDDYHRKSMSDQLEIAGSNYREKVYKGFAGGKKGLLKAELLDFLKISKVLLDDTIGANQRKDGLYHSYNLISIKGDKMEIQTLHEMLEGQVSVLGSGYLSSEGALEVLGSLRKSAMYRKDQHSYMLYPDRELSIFTDKNIIPEEGINKSTLLKKLLKEDNKAIVQKDSSGKVHFNSGFNNASALKSALDKLSKSYPVNGSDIDGILDIYEKVFDHRTFTGRSGTFFKYEGLGSIYWHMVSKLLLVTAEIIQNAGQDRTSPETIEKLVQHYQDIQAGIGLHKNPENYGGFTTDPYSHTPSMLGAQQPGLTGQVKEDILTRWYELGVIVENGQIVIRPVLLRKREFLIPSEEEKKKGMLMPTLKFSFCGVAFEYVMDDHEGINIHYNWGEVSHFGGFTIDSATSRDIASRSGRIVKVLVKISEKRLIP